MIEPILIVGIVVALTAWYMQHRWRRWRARNVVVRDSAALEMLGRRYARGEIDREEYLQKRADILGFQVVSPTFPKSRAA
jgi:putative membrane protein